MGRELISQVLQDYRTAPIGEKLRATLVFLERVTLAPEQVTAADAGAVLAAGVSPAGLVEALDVLFIFSTFDRLADALGWEISTPEEYQRWGKFLFERGYSR